MARVVKPLNDTQIKNAKPIEKNFTLPDGQGLQLLVKINGSKLWEFYYKSPTELKRKKTSFGNYPQTSLKTARDKRADYLELISKGIDPINYYNEIKQKVKEEQLKKVFTIQKVLDDYYEYKKANNEIQEQTIQKDKPRVENHFIPKLPKKEDTNINDITFDMITKSLKALEKEDKLSTLTKVKGILIRVFKYAYAQNIINDVSIFGKLELYNFKKDTQTINNPTLTEKEDIKNLYESIISYEHSKITRYLLLFTVHTAQRQGSIITAKWSDINFDEKLWIIPKENMKGTLKSKKTHHLPLSNITIEFLKELHSITGDNEYLFPNSQINVTRNKYPHISNNTVTKALRVMGYSKEQQTAHGFRAMFKTVCKEHQEEHNINNEFVERILAHKVDGEVEGAYNRAKNIEDMRKIVNWWSNYLLSLKDNVE